MSTADRAFDRMSGMVLEDGALWGEVAVEHQVEDARAILTRDPDAPRKQFITRPRGGSKTTDLAGITLAVLIDQAPSAARCYVAAADKDQARLLLDAAEGLIDRTPGLSRILQVDAFRITNTTNGATLEVLAADGASTWGLRPFFAIADEIGNWPETRNHRKVWTGLVSAFPKVKGGRLVAMTSAGEPSHFSYPIREQAAKQSKGWRLSEMPGPVPWLSETDLAELREELAATPSAYDRLVLNEWTEGEDRLTTREAVLECVRHEGRLRPVPDRGYYIGVDLGISNDATAIVVLHPELVDLHTPQNVHDVALAGSTLEEWLVIDHVKKFQGTRRRPVQLTEVEEEIRLLASAYGKRKVKIIADTYQSLGMVQHLADAGFDAVDVPFTPELHNRIATTLYRLLENRHLDLPNDPWVIDELSTVRLVRSHIGLKIDHDAGRHNDFTMALGLAAIECLDIQKGRKIKRLSTARSYSPLQGRNPVEANLARQLQRLADKGDVEALDVLRRRAIQRPRRSRR
jgi:phage terminase large subunit-like protein